MFGVDPVDLLQSYGYLALLIGTFLEGETIVIIAGFLAQQELLSPPLIALCAFCGSVTSDQFMFILGRWKGMAIIQRFEKLEKKVAKAARLLARYETPLILGFRFIYGVRNVTPILMGVSGVSHLKFLVLNVIGAAVWAVSFTAAGYFFGQAVTVFLEAVPHAGRYVLGGLAAVIFVVWLVHKRRKKKRERATELVSPDPLERTIATIRRENPPKEGPPADRGDGEQPPLS
ncbi:putative membrane-associated protein [uncultured delta proteobacterium]|uniref:Putative membrane-associated protein n=1 Tax=uncultured delta proteobacterium TaxID=34034 RepID=A0A212JJJ9_9DELT|nr:putative membrane-associated protein [uncultured delta proteobacterium]